MDEKNYTLLIYKRLSDTLTSEESKMLAQWLNKSADNRALADEIEAVFNLTADYQASEIASIDVDAALKEQMTLISTEPVIKNKPKQGKIRRLTVIRRIATAAVIAIAALVAWNVWMPTTSTSRIEVVAADDREKVTLPDGSEVWLTQNSRISYEKDFSGKQRDIELNGEGVFKVTKNPTKPFVVTTDLGTVQVLGTIFDLKEDKKQLTLKVLEGKVRFSLKNIKQPVEVTANQEAVGNAMNKRIEVRRMKEGTDLAWYNGVLYFKDLTIQEVVATLSTHFDVNIELANKKLVNCTFTNRFDKKDLSEILSVIDEIFGSQSVQQSDLSYVITGGACE